MALEKLLILYLKIFIMSNKLSIIIPTFREGKIIDSSVNEINLRLQKEKIDFEILVVDDHSNDQTLEKIKKISSINKHISFHLNSASKGFGNSIVEGIKKASGDYVCFVMADKSDSPDDIVKYFSEIQNSQFDCVFGDRWSNKKLVQNYPITKYYFNRFGNIILSKLFQINYKDLTNSFKMYKRSVLLELLPLISYHFSITVEIPLKIIYRGYKFSVIPNSWKNNEHSVSNLKISHVVLTYSLIIFYCLIERYFIKKQDE